MKIGKKLLALGLSLVISTQSIAANSAYQLFDQIQNKTNPDHMIETKKLVVDDDGELEETEFLLIKTTQNQSNYNSVIFILQPKSKKGKASLSQTKDNVTTSYKYTPSNKKFIRTAQNNKNSSIMGSNFNTADLEKVNMDNNNFEFHKLEGNRYEKSWGPQSTAGPKKNLQNVH